jgi:2-polyprenyl-3-methyl-5-hydroxy-6-metoxy-1,4-benzoquinol methylase
MIKIHEMPLYWRSKKTPHVTTDEPPERFPFGFAHNQEFDLFIESRSPELTSLLEDIYSRNANVGFLQDGHSLIATYGNDFWRFLSDLLHDYPVRQVVDVGCGGCVLLERLKKEGCGVLGVDPSPFALEAGKKKGITVIQECFPPLVGLPIVPDLIFQVDVLEHIESPLKFIQAQVECLKDGGLIVVNVPDCSASINRGDISMALHQHVNMFDMISLPRVLQAAGLTVVRLEKSRYGGALYCAAIKTTPKNRFSAAPSKTRLLEFEAKATENIRRFIERVESAKQNTSKIGFFMPQRAFPYLGMIDFFEGFRVFDNLNLWHNRYLDGLNIPIENQADLIANPVDHLFIMSLTFGATVASEILGNCPNLRITTLDDILL